MKRTALVVTTLAVSSLLTIAAGAAVRMIQPNERSAKVVTSTSPHRTVEANAKEKWVGKKAIIVDANTGKLRRPTAEETADLVRSLKQLTRKPSNNGVTFGDGTRQGNVNGASASVVIGRPRTDGTVETLCVQTFEEAAAFLGLEPASEK